MKKIIILLCAIIVFMYSITNAVAGWYNFWVLNYSEKQQVGKVANKIITVINNQWGCDTKLYENLYKKIIMYKDNYYTWSKKHAIFSYIQYIIDNQYNGCRDTIGEEIISDFLSEIDMVSEKKWDFVKNIWWDVEARQNSMYTYFYREDILINTVKNKINNDKYGIFWHNYNGWHNENDYLSSYYSEQKLNLYSAHTYYDPDGVKKLEFSKQTDFGTKYYTYNIVTQKWED